MCDLRVIFLLVRVRFQYKNPVFYSEIPLGGSTTRRTGLMGLGNSAFSSSSKMYPDVTIFLPIERILDRWSVRLEYPDGIDDARGEITCLLAISNHYSTNNSLLNQLVASSYSASCTIHHSSMSSGLV